MKYSDKIQNIVLKSFKKKTETETNTKPKSK